MGAHNVSAKKVRKKRQIAFAIAIGWWDMGYPEMDVLIKKIIKTTSKVLPM